MKLMKIYQKQIGFTLVEMAIVIVILGLLLTAFLVPLQAQRSVAFQLETENILRNSKQALLGFSQTNGRLPCPATIIGGGEPSPDGTGTENQNPVGSGVCKSQIGFLPASTLGIQPTDDAGFALDAWNNRIIYAVTNADANAFTKSGDMNDLGLSNLNPDLSVCSTSTGTTAAACSGTSKTLINNAVVVVYSTGATGALASGGADENENSIPLVAGIDKVFVSHDIRANDPNGEFDHLVVWLSPYVLYNEMIRAGQLH